MSPDPTLTELAQHPERVRELPIETTEKLLIQVHVIQGALIIRLLAGQAQGNGGAPADPEGALTLEEAASLLRTSKDSLYRKWRKLPFAYKDPLDGRIKFNRSGLQRYMRQQQGRN